LFFLRPTWSPGSSTGWLRHLRWESELAHSKRILQTYCKRADRRSCWHRNSWSALERAHPNSNRLRVRARHEVPPPPAEHARFAVGCPRRNQYMGSYNAPPALTFFFASPRAPASTATVLTQDREGIGVGFASANTIASSSPRSDRFQVVKRPRI
jgi:hypothetical protein